MRVRALFEEELRRRELAFKIDPKTGRYSIEIEGGVHEVGIESLARNFERDGDAHEVSSFIDAIVASASFSDEATRVEELYWCLEPNDYIEAAQIRVPVSKRVDRALVHLSADGSLITWVTPEMLRCVGVTEAEAGEKAFANLARSLEQATFESEDLDGVKLGFLTSELPFKASLILAPNLREVVGKVLGWPLMAVLPSRDFQYIWGAQHRDFVQRVGGVAVREYQKAAYPISTEVYEISDEGIRAIGEFSQRQ